MTHEEILQVLRAGNAAPSGENSQPWRFVEHNDAIEVWNRPERDQSYYNWGQRGSYMSIGAAIENISLASGSLGYVADIEYFPDNDEHVATIRFVAGGTADPLAAVIESRASNRKPYSTETLTDAERSSIAAAADATPGLEYTLIEDPQARTVLGGVGAVNESVMLTNEALHQFFFSHINWTKAEDDANTIGFYIKTLELPPPAVAIFKLLRSWRVASFLTRTLKFHRVICKQNSVTNASASAIAVISSSGTDPVDYVAAGRLLERIWLSATNLGLSAQPMIGVFFLKLLLEREPNKFSSEQAEQIRKACSQAQDIAKTSAPVIAMLRIGHGGSPSARSSRFPLESAMS